jgi:hypothetical protein
VTTLIPVIDRLRRRFSIARVCVVADRGMMSAATVAELAGIIHEGWGRPGFRDVQGVGRGGALGAFVRA